VDRDAALVAALGAAVLGAACTSSSKPTPTPSPTTPSPAPVDPDIAVLKGWYLAESAMARRYGGGNAPDFGDWHRGHLLDIGDFLRVRGEPPPRVPRGRVPLRGARAELLKLLGGHERTLAAEYQGMLAGVRDPKVATLGAELSAACRQYAAIMLIEKT